VARVTLPLAAAVLLAGLTAPATEAAEDAAPFTPAEVQRILRHSPVPPLPPDETNAVADAEGAARLGRRLFFDTRLSGDGRLSCASCHDPARGFTDGRPTAQGARPGRRNTPSLWNVAYNRWFFWDGRADSLWSQALKPIEGPDELGGNRRGAVSLLARDPVLRAEYQAVFAEPPDASGPPGLNRSFANLGKAIAAFERRLLSRRSPFDVFAAGLRESDPEKMAALGPSARRGLKLFVGRGQCGVCHAGPLFSDGEFHDVGVPDAADAESADLGRDAGIPALLRDEFNAAGPYSDAPAGPRARQVRFLAPPGPPRRAFKTPSLRNVAVTGPYMHQGQLATLADVVRHYSLLEDQMDSAAHRETLLVALHLSAGEAGDLIAFLESLTDATPDPGVLE
jgi:cytochrome c peroxidase